MFLHTMKENYNCQAPIWHKSTKNMSSCFSICFSPWFWDVPDYNLEHDRFDLFMFYLCVDLIIFDTAFLQGWLFTNPVVLVLLAICGGRPFRTDNQDTHAERQRGQGRCIPGFGWSWRPFPFPKSRISRWPGCPAGMWHPCHRAEPLSYFAGHWRWQPQQPGSVQTSYTWPCLCRGCESALCSLSIGASSVNVKWIRGFSLLLFKKEE